MRTSIVTKSTLVATFALLSLIATNPVSAEFYLGIFGGRGNTKKTHVE